jgi:hypothetical protein
VASEPGKGSVFTVRLPGGAPSLTSSAVLFRVRNKAPNGGDQSLEVDRFGIELVAARGNGLLALAVQRIGEPLSIASMTTASPRPGSRWSAPSRAVARGLQATKQLRCRPA